jgi:S1-C subfamily serine protease
LTVREVTFFDIDENRWDESIAGVIVDQLGSAGWTELGGLYPGDLIQQIDHHPITSLDEYRQAMEEVSKRQPERVVFVVLRGVLSAFQFVEPDWRPDSGKKNETDPNQE